MAFAAAAAAILAIVVVRSVHMRARLLPGVTRAPTRVAVSIAVAELKAAEEDEVASVVVKECLAVPLAKPLPQICDELLKALDRGAGGEAPVRVGAREDAAGHDGDGRAMRERKVLRG